MLGPINTIQNESRQNYHYLRKYRLTSTIINYLSWYLKMWVEVFFKLNNFWKTNSNKWFKQHNVSFVWHWDNIYKFNLKNVISLQHLNSYTYEQWACGFHQLKPLKNFMRKFNFCLLQINNGKKCLQSSSTLFKLVSSLVSSDVNTHF